MISIGTSGHASSAARGTTHGLSFGLVPWLNQSWIMNCSHAATNEFTLVAGTNSVRVSNARLTSRGLGVSTPSGGLDDLVERDVAAEAGSGGTHRFRREVVVGAVHRASDAVVRRRRRSAVC